MKFPIRHQLESVDCGPTCIQMVAAYYGKEISLSLLKNYCNVTRLGISLKDVIEGGSKIGLYGVGVRINKNEIGCMPLPAILYWKQEHYLVLYHIKRKKNNNIYYLADPAFGKVILDESELLKDWTTDNMTGIAIVLEPTSKFYEHKNKVSKINDLKKNLEPFRFLTRYKKNISLGLFWSTITFICAWFIPFILQKIIDEGIGGKNMNLVFLFLLCQLVLFIGNLISNFLNNTILFKTGLNIGIDVATKYIRKLVRLPVHFFDTKLGTDLLQRLNDEQRIREFLTYTVNTVILMTLNMLVYSSILAYYNSYIFLLFLTFTLLSAFLAKFVLKKRKLLNYLLFSAYSNKKNTEYELINGMIEIKTNTAHDIFLSKWEDTQKDINKFTVKNLYLEYYLNTGSAFFNILRDIIITGACAYLVINNQMTIGIMMTISYILGQLSGSVNQISNFVKAFQDSKLAYDRIEEIQRVPDENTNRQISISEDKKFKDSFRFENVSFKYDGTFNPYVLIDINTIIRINEVTAIVGASGSGKTTMLKLLLGFYYPQKGNLSLDGVKMFDINSIDWHKKCGVVMQDGYIFSDTIARNIALSDSDPDNERVQEAARIACINDFIEQLPMRYNTKIGKSGIDLSGGQKQRILIARAVYKNPDFIFFDEATSSLDANNEMQIMNNLKEFYKGRTVVIIAHRLSTVKDADSIIVLDRGHLVEQGSHLELAQKKGFYYNLVKNQLELGVS